MLCCSLYKVPLLFFLLSLKFNCNTDHVSLPIYEHLWCFSRLYNTHKNVRILYRSWALTSVIRFWSASGQLLYNVKPAQSMSSYCQLISFRVRLSGQQLPVKTVQNENLLNTFHIRNLISRQFYLQPVPDLGLWRPLGNNVIEKSS